MLICYTIFYFVIFKGIKFSSKIALFTVISPYILLFILLFKILFLPESRYGLKYMTVPRFSHLLRPCVWQSALNQSFFQNNIGSGIALTFASLYGNQSSAATASKVLASANVFSSLLSSVIVFGFIGYFAFESGVGIEELPLSGASLVFVTYPATLSLFPFPRVWLCIFFLSLLFLSVDSQIGTLEAIAHFFIDSKKSKNPPKFMKWFGSKSDQQIRLFVCIFSLIFGLPMCFQSGFRYLAFINQFCTIIVPCIGVIINIWLFFYSNFDVKVSPMIKACLTYLAIPLVASIMISWLFDVPRLLHNEYIRGDFFTLFMGIFFNFFMIIFPISYYVIYR